MEQKVTSVEEYRKTKSPIKIFPLPSGAIFQLRKITTRDYINEGGVSLPLQSISEIELGVTETSIEKNKIIWNKLTDEQKQSQVTLSSKLVIRAVVSPQLSLIPEDGKLCIEELGDEDFYALLTEISQMSFGGGQKDKSFRVGTDTIVTGPTGEEILPDAIGDAGQTDS